MPRRGSRWRTGSICSASGCNGPVPRYVAFLRAINVGGHTVKMDRLRSLFEEMGLDDVTTFIASGNVLFASPQRARTLEGKISKQLAKALGYPVGVFLRTRDQLAAVARHPPFTAAEVDAAASLYVCFLPEAGTESQAAAVAAESTLTQELRLHGRELYWLSRTRLSDSDVNEGALGKALAMPMTMRNMNTVRRILAKFG
jgi:uncharacterized protein (DUF1697 family)